MNDIHGIVKIYTYRTRCALCVSSLLLICVFAVDLQLRGFACSVCTYRIVDLVTYRIAYFPSGKL